MARTQKGGCILINPKEKTVALVYRETLNDYSFPKGHLEEGENIQECAIRETNEETKRECILLEKNPINVEEYTTPKGEDVTVYYYLAKDNGPSDNKSEETHPTYWIPFSKVEEKLTYEDSKEFWNSIKEKVESYME